MRCYLSDADVDFIAIIFVAIIAICILALLGCIVAAALYGVTCFWRETTLEEVIEAEIVEAEVWQNEDTLSFHYSLKVKGTDSTGQVWMRTYHPRSETYLEMSKGSTLSLEIKKTVQPIFGEEVTIKPIYPEA